MALIALSAFVMVGSLGLVFDAGQMFILKNELQTFADASAMAAVSKLDGSQTGVQTANSVATAGPLGTTKPNGYNFDTITITNITTGFASTFTGVYDNYATANSTPTNTFRFISVVATQNLDLSFMPVLQAASSIPISAKAVAGQQAVSDVTNAGVVPFAPDAHNPSDTTNFGFVPGQEYTLKWGNGNTTDCAGDAGFDPGMAPSGHGFVNIGQGNATSAIRQAIDYGGYPNSSSTPSTLYQGEDLNQDPGNKGSSIFDALAARSEQDPDQTDLTVPAYEASLLAGTANGRRIVTAPIINPATWSGTGTNANAIMIGFGNFLLDPGATIEGSSGPICATLYRARRY
jgi:Flp pilus assembly protein TadG